MIDQEPSIDIPAETKSGVFSGFIVAIASLAGLVFALFIRRGVRP